MRADRLLSILLLLQSHGRMTARQLAGRLEVSERTIHRDMEALGAAGVPVVADRGAGGGWSLMEGYKTDLSGLTEAEARAIFVANPGRILADLRLDKAARSAFAKLLATVAPAARRSAEIVRNRIHIDVRGWHRSRDAVPHLPVLHDAVWNERKVRILYGDEPSPSERIVAPLGLVAKGSVWYLVGEVSGELRTYRVSRIREASMLDETFLAPPGFDLARYWEESSAQFRERLPRYDVVIRAPESELRWIEAMMRYGGIDEVTRGPNGFARVAMHFDTIEVARTVLLGVADRIDILQPRKLRDLVAEAARAALTKQTSSRRRSSRVS